MKLRTEVTSEKLRGGYYTPPELTAFCWRRALDLTGTRHLRVLEPAAGDGAFFSILPTDFHDRVAEIVAVEIDAVEAAKCAAVLARAQLPYRVYTASFLNWSLEDESSFDVAIGNPPFVRFQFVSPTDSAAMVMLGLRLGIKIEGVSNLWMPMLLAALQKLSPGGSAAFVVPAELFTGMSAGAVRQWMRENLEELTVDLFPPGRFPGVLQEVVVVSGRRAHNAATSSPIRVVQHRGSASEQSWNTEVRQADASWMRAFLSPSQSDALDTARSISALRPLGDLARVQVSIVTGANDYFCVSDSDLEEYDLARWALPLLPRARHAAGVVWRRRDQAKLPSSAKSWLVHFAEDAPRPERYAGASRFLAEGVRRGIPDRYKCRVRSPWYRVPDVWSGNLLLSKRAHRFPRLILNAARSYTTDTIYRGRMRLPYAGRERDLVALFHNSLTLLTAELEGRSFGGGVHELVPSEISRLAVPLIEGAGVELDVLDAFVRDPPETEEERLIERTNEALLRVLSELEPSVLVHLEDARRTLMQKRLDRSEASRSRSAEQELLAV